MRDLLAGWDPKDYDIATSARPEEIRLLYPKADEIGAHFGVMLVRRGGHHFVIATFGRTAITSTDAVPPRSPFPTRLGCAAARFHDQRDVFRSARRARHRFHGRPGGSGGETARAIGRAEDRFREDYLRLLRAVRFATVLGFEIEAGTWEAIRAVAGHITVISPERIREELDKIWLSPDRVRGFDLLVASGLMEAILPEILALQGCEQPPHFHPEGDVFVHTL